MCCSASPTCPSNRLAAWFLSFHPLLCSLLSFLLKLQPADGTTVTLVCSDAHDGEHQQHSLSAPTHAHTHHSSTSGKTARASTRPPRARAHCRHQLTAAAAAGAHLGRGLASTRAALSHKETQNPEAATDQTVQNCTWQLRPTTQTTIWFTTTPAPRPTRHAHVRTQAGARLQSVRRGDGNGLCSSSS